MNFSWEIPKISKKINKTILPNTLSVGFDVAEYKTGISIILTTQSYIKWIGKYIIEIPKKDDIVSKLKAFQIGLITVKEEFSKYKSKRKIVVIEDCFLKYSVWVLKILARFSTIAFMEFKNSASDIFFVQAKSARNRVGIKDKYLKQFKTAKQGVVNWINSNFEIFLEDKDIADSFVLALVGVLKNYGRTRYPKILE